MRRQYHFFKNSIRHALLTSVGCRSKSRCKKQPTLNSTSKWPVIWTLSHALSLFESHVGRTKFSFYPLQLFHFSLAPNESWTNSKSVRGFSRPSRLKYLNRASLLWLAVNFQHTIFTDCDVSCDYFGLHDCISLCITKVSINKYSGNKWREFLSTFSDAWPITAVVRSLGLDDNPARERC